MRVRLCVSEVECVVFVIFMIILSFGGGGRLSLALPPSFSFFLFSVCVVRCMCVKVKQPLWLSYLFEFISRSLPSASTFVLRTRFGATLLNAASCFVPFPCFSFLCLIFFLASLLLVVRVGRNNIKVVFWFVACSGNRCIVLYIFLIAHSSTTNDRKGVYTHTQGS